jgi:hypothetical protein
MFNIMYRIKLLLDISFTRLLLTTNEGPHCNGNPIYVFLFWELRGLSPNFDIRLSVSDLYCPRIGPQISYSRIGRPIV